MGWRRDRLPAPDALRQPPRQPDGGVTAPHPGPGQLPATELMLAVVRLEDRVKALESHRETDIHVSLSLFGGRRRG